MDEMLIRIAKRIAASEELEAAYDDLIIGGIKYKDVKIKFKGHLSEEENKGTDEVTYLPHVDEIVSATANITEMVNANLRTNNNELMKKLEDVITDINATA